MDSPDAEKEMLAEREGSLILQAKAIPLHEITRYDQLGRMLLAFYVLLCQVESHFDNSGMWIRRGSRWGGFCAIARRSGRWFRCW